MRRESTLREMGLGPVWRLRDAPVDNIGVSPVPKRGFPAVTPTSAAVEQAPARQHLTPTLAAGEGRGEAIARMDWPELKSTVADCDACMLCRERKQAVLGVGDVNADWLFIGEGPGAEEDERGEPFVGQAGKLLDAMLAAIDLKRGDDVYIANAVKCRPPDNRTPDTEETSACWPFLERQVALIKPKLIVALGKPAAQTLLNAEVKISASRGRLFDFKGIPLIITYHPAYLLRNLADKAKAWEDLCFMRSTMRKLKGTV